MICSRAKNNLKRAANRLQKNPFNRGCQDQLVNAKKNYKKTCKEAESKYRKHLLEKLLQAEDPKEFWNIMNNMKGWGRETEDPCNSIAPSSWSDYFKKVLNPDKREDTHPPPKKEE